MEVVSPARWIESCAVQLQSRWRTVASAELEEVAVELWRDPALRVLAPEEAAERWLAPITAAPRQPS